MEPIDPSIDTSIPPPPGVDVDEHRRYHSYECRPRSRDRDRDRSRHDRNRDTRHDRDGRGSYSDNDHRSYHEPDNHRREKDHDNRHDRKSYRDRSRDRMRDRDRIRDRDREREYDRPRDRDYDREKKRDFREREEIPNSTILVKGLGPLVTEDDIKNEVTRYSLFPKDIVIMRRKSTGESRGFAYVEFGLLSDAVRWKELTDGVLYFGPNCATLHYFLPKDIPEGDRPLPRLDWTCIKCGVNNFKKRDFCFKCNAPRAEAELANIIGGEGCEEVSNSASSTLLFRNLDILTTEERVLSMLGQITVLPIKNLKVAKDSLTHTSRGFAYVELHSISEAMQLHDLLISMAGNFYVDGRSVTVSYSRYSLSTMNSVASANAATVALAAAQWTNQGTTYTSQPNTNMFSDSVIRERQIVAAPSFNANDYQKYSTPDISTYQYDETSGYYYDSITGFYYDPNSRYYYNSETQEYLYWDSEKQTYLAVPTTQPTTSTAVIQAPATTSLAQKTEVVISSPPVIVHAPVLSIKKEPVIDKPKQKNNPPDRVKIAKKVAKNMEKWAKTLNQKKESAKASAPVISPQVINTTNVEVVLDKKKTGIVFEVPKATTKDPMELIKTMSNKEKSIALVAAYGGESDSEVETDSQDDGARALEVLKTEESKLIDWTKIACLLCKRQFLSKDILTKHIQLSDLHKQNVHMLKLTKLSPKQLQELEKREAGYRDRAKERREKFGQPDVPPPSKLKSKYLKEKRDAYLPPEEPAEAIGSDNIGNKMLKAMGWTEGQGLGKTGQGMSGIIEVQRRVKSAGLGMKGASYGANASDSYKDAVRKAMQARYNEVT